MTRAAFFTRIAIFGALIASAGSLARAEAPALPECRKTWSSLIPKDQHSYARGETYAAYSARVRRAACAKDWVILVYMVADSGLEPYALRDLYEMEAGYASANRWAGSTLKADLVAEVDLASAGKVERRHLWQSKDAYRELPLAAATPAISSPVISQFARKGGVRDRFDRFVQWGIARYPARHVMVVVWGHGQGWSARRGPKAPSDWGGMAFDEADGSFLSTRALAATLSRASATLGRKVDLFVADSCLMQMAEVVTEVSPAVSFVVGSDEVQPQLGLPYRRILYELNQKSLLAKSLAKTVALDSVDEGYQLAWVIPRLFQASFDPSQGLQGKLDPAAISRLTLSSVVTDTWLREGVPALSELGRSGGAGAPSRHFRSAIRSRLGSFRSRGPLRRLFAEARWIWRRYSVRLGKRSPR